MSFPLLTVHQVESTFTKPSSVLPSQNFFTLQQQPQDTVESIARPSIAPFTFKQSNFSLFDPQPPQLKPPPALPPPKTGTELEAEQIVALRSSLQELIDKLHAVDPLKLSSVQSWDFYKNSHEKSGLDYRSPFLTEGSEDVWQKSTEMIIKEDTGTEASSSKHVVQPEKATQDLLRATIGSASAKTIAYDESEMRFNWVGSIHGINSKSSNLIVENFLKIGTGSIRLSNLVSRLFMSATSSQASNSFAHALKTCVELIQSELEQLFESDINSPISSALRPATPVSSKGKEKEVTDSHLSLIQLNTRLSKIGEIIQALCDLCRLPYNKPPSSHAFPPKDLLSHVHLHLLAHITSASSIQVQSILAFILNKTAKGWLSIAEDWVGLKRDRRFSMVDKEVEGQWKSLGIRSRKVGFAFEGLKEKDGEAEFDYDFDPTFLPSFVPESVGKEIFESGLAYRLLKQVKPDHPLCRAVSLNDWRNKDQVWIWTDDGIATFQRDLGLFLRQTKRSIHIWTTSESPTAFATLSSTSKTFGLGLSNPSQSAPSLNDPLPPSISDLVPTITPAQHPVGKIWDVFDLAPGTSVNREVIDQHEIAKAELIAFLSQFPSNLTPSASATAILNSQNILPQRSAPSFEILTSLTVFPPLSSFGLVVGKSLVDIFFRDLDLKSQFEILRSFFLFGNEAFSRRFKQSIFAREGDDDDLGKVQGTRARALTRLGFKVGQSSSSTPKEPIDDNWGVGLGLGLSDRRRWPPGGFDLSYALSTVLSDSLEEVIMNKEAIEKLSTSDDSVLSDTHKNSDLWKEASKRLGFGVKDLKEEAADGQATWLNPQSLDALDFLYLDYEPPRQVSAIIHSDILSKYHRIFNFIVRLFRIENVIRGLHRDIFFGYMKPSLKSGVDHHLQQSKERRVLGRRSSSLLFEDNLRARSFCLRFRFRVSHFVNALCSFTFDTAIQQNWGNFTKRIDRLHREATTRYEGHTGAAEDDTGTEDETKVLEDIGELKSVFALAAYHEQVLDRILVSLMLKSRQQGLQKLLDGALTTVLTFGKVVKQVLMGTLDEMEAWNTLVSAERDFITYSSTLLRVLKSLSVGRGGLNTEHQLRSEEHGWSADWSVLVLLLELEKMKGEGM